MFVVLHGLACTGWRTFISKVQYCMNEDKVQVGRFILTNGTVYHIYSKSLCVGNRTRIGIINLIHGLNFMDIEEHRTKSLKSMNRSAEASHKLHFRTDFSSSYYYVKQSLHDVHRYCINNRSHWSACLNMGMGSRPVVNLVLPYFVVGTVYTILSCILVCIQYIFDTMFKYRMAPQNCPVDARLTHDSWLNKQVFTFSYEATMREGWGMMGVRINAHQCKYSAFFRTPSTHHW